ncbi:MAG: lytic transglycosylase domain-containing protein [Thermoanaerobaculia bacterium]|nr:lytic transglycosylase domain-containing protein [Thermoanaerobaculia bacterium]
MSSHEPRHRPSRSAGRARRLRRPGLLIALLAPFALAVVLAAWARTPVDSDPATPLSIPLADYRALEIDSARLRSCEPGPTVAPAATRLERVVRGLAAYDCDDLERAVELLALPDAVHDPLEDWRLLALAESALATDRLELAADAAEALAQRHPGSFLDERAALALARIDRRAGRLERALGRVRESRAERLSPDIRLALDILAWEVAVELGRAVDLTDESRHMLLYHPLDALELEVARSLRGDSEELVWAEHFEPQQLLARARRLIAADLLNKAFDTLAGVAPAERDLDWHLLQAEALVEDRRGREALETLEGVAAPDVPTLLEIEWLRGLGALDAATARRGRVNLPHAARVAMRLEARRHLYRVIAEGGDSGRAVDAHRRLFEDLADGEHFDEVMAVLRSLRRIDPDDDTGARYLWQLGWGEYDRRNYSGAIGYWSELGALYPDDKLARAADYWSGRCHEALGNAARAERIYEAIAAIPATDYYGKHAVARLGRPPRAEAAPPLPAPQTWPSDPVLARAELLTDLGIDRLGLEEVEALAGVGERRATEALKSRILARQGRRRDSIQSLWRVFPTLGTPEQVSVPDDALRMYYPLDFLDVIERHAETNRLGVTVLLAMVRQESAFDVSARSYAGARGLMQVMPATAQELARNMGLPFSTDRLDDPDYSVRLGSRYFRQVLDMFDGNLEIALAGYNAGPYRIKRLLRNAGSNPETDRFVEGLPIEESKTYVKRIVLFSDSYERLYPDLG